MYTRDFDAIDTQVQTKWSNSKFVISMFDTVEDIENKVLCSNHIILFIDEDKSGTECVYVITKQKGKQYIFIKDVIDCLVKNKFEPRNKFLEDFTPTNMFSLNDNHVRIFKGFWGS